MTTVDEIVKQLAEVTDELLALEDDDFAGRFRLETRRDELRAEAEEFHQRKDEGRSTEQLHTELSARREQLQQISEGFVNRAMQASSAHGPSGGEERASAALKGRSINDAMMGASGAGSIHARIAEIEQELAKR